MNSKRVLVAGATGYIGKFVVKTFKKRGYFVRVLARNREKLHRSGPFTAPALTVNDYDELFIGEITKPETLTDLTKDIDIIYSSIGISRQRDGLTFDQVDYGCNKTLIDMAKRSGVKKFIYVSMLDADKIAHLEITKAHEKVVEELQDSGMKYTIIRPSGYYSDMGAILNMAEKGRVYLLGKGENRLNPIFGGDLAEVCVQAADEDETEIEAGGPEILTQKEMAELAFEVLGKKPKISIFPLWLGRILVKLLRLLSKQYGDLADFFVTAAEIESVGPQKGELTLREYFMSLI